MLRSRILVANEVVVATVLLMECRSSSSLPCSSRGSSVKPTMLAGRIYAYILYAVLEGD
jgi:hypothetical protein